MSSRTKELTHVYFAVTNEHEWTIWEGEAWDSDELAVLRLPCSGDRALENGCPDFDLARSYARSFGARIKEPN